MRRFIPFFIIIVFLLSSCSKAQVVENVEYKEPSEEQRASFLTGYGVIVDVTRPVYSSKGTIPKIFDTVWEIRDTLSKKSLNIDISKYKGKQCSIFMYPVVKLPFTIKKESTVETRVVVISCQDSIICSYIEFISELRTLPATALSGQSIVDYSGVKWDTWKQRIDDDDNKRLVIFLYYDSLKLGSYNDAYNYIYDKGSIKKEDFIIKAKENKLPSIDFINIDQYKIPTADESYFIIEASVSGSSVKGKLYELTIDLKKDPKEKLYGGWKIYQTKIK